MIDSLTTVAVVVSNAKKAVAWYQQALGFEIRDHEGHWVTVAPPRSNVLLHLSKQAKLEPGNTGIAFAAKDLKGTCQELEEKGKVLPPVQRGGPGHLRNVQGPGRQRLLACACVTSKVSLTSDSR